MGSTDWRPFKNTLRCEPFPCWKVAPCLASQRLNSFAFMEWMLNTCVVFVECGAKRNSERRRENAKKMGCQEKDGKGEWNPITQVD